MVEHSGRRPRVQTPAQKKKKGGKNGKSLETESRLKVCQGLGGGRVEVIANENAFFIE
jgi:hypothetical protein